MSDPSKFRLAPRLPEMPGQHLTWTGLSADSSALAISQAAASYRGILLVITPDTPSALQLESALNFFGGSQHVLVFPDWETLPYDIFSPHQDIVSQRLLTLNRLPTTDRGVVVIPVSTLAQRLAPREWLEGHCFVLSPGDRLNPAEFRRRLDNAGYRCVSQVREHGDFALRGALFDIFPMGSDCPLRIDLFDDEIESIREFNPETQISTRKVSSVQLLPAREFPLDEPGIARFRRAFRTAFQGSADASPVYRDVSSGFAPGGIEYYLPLFFEETGTFFDYLPDRCVALLIRGALDSAGEFHEQAAERYEQRRHDLERPLLPLGELFLSPSQLAAKIEALARVTLHPGDSPGPSLKAAALELPDLRFQLQANAPAAALNQFLSTFSGRVLFTAESAGRRELLSETLGRHGIHPESVAGWSAFLASEKRLALTVAPLERGFLLPGHGQAVIPESVLEGERVHQRRRRSARKDLENVVSNLNELEIGAPVVHEDHGVGRYRGLETLASGGLNSEFLVLEYAGGDRLYVPVSALHLIRRYTGASEDTAPLHKLGNDQWQRIKRKAAEKARDAAAELLDIYARRQARPGHAFEFDHAEYQRFAAAFPFEETPDQLSAIDATIRDMSAGRPMDRVICGDVGFGKTEVAMRAAFVAVQGGRQVAVLVPTTLLAQQHHQNFLDRFAEWPIRVEMLSRFRSRKQQDEILGDMSGGTVDIVIGTHKLLQSDVRFRALGLVIIDEEHRFGVRHKERMKSLRSEVDVLTLTATPIPRTLNMSLSGLRDLSVIATPPAERLAVKTFVGEWNPGVVQEACQREIKRGGQVYFLHNAVESIERMARVISEMVPGARIGIAHGQMRETELERVMLDFYHQRCNVLVCTTIIESGIDVPSANTIVINRADKLGLAQLHQLRGRVGRSHHRAYSYLIVPHRKAMTADAVKRIEAIESLEDLGAGFLLATHDLEIRGAGELLGEEQSGQIQEVGFSLYAELLERAVEALKSGREPDLGKPLQTGPEIDLQVPALLPADFLPDVHTRLIMYKRIAHAENAEQLRALQVEMIDRFGLLPDPAKTLLRVTEMKLETQRIGIRKISAGPTGGRIQFEDEPRIDFGRVMRLIREQGQIYRLDGQDKLRFNVEMPDADSRIQTVSRLLEEVAA